MKKIIIIFFTITFLFSCSEKTENLVNSWSLNTISDEDLISIDEMYLTWETLNSKRKLEEENERKIEEQNRKMLEEYNKQLIIEYEQYLEDTKIDILLLKKKELNTIEYNEFAIELEELNKESLENYKNEIKK